MKVGRPPKYETPREMQTIIDLYFIACKINNLKNLDVDTDLLSEKLNEDEMLTVEYIECYIPTVSGLAYTLGMSRQALVDYEGKKEFLDTVKRAKQRVEMSLEQRLAGNNVAGSIFNLKNNFGWKDKTEQDVNNNVNITMPDKDAGTL
jgi:hypothetical protein